MRPHIAIDFTGDGTAHLLSDILGINQCRWFKVYGVAIASTAARVGDSSAATSHGAPVTTTIPFETPTNSMLNELYDLTGWYVNAVTSDKIAVIAAA
jgi:hypothetical protein